MEVESTICTLNGLKNQLKVSETEIKTLIHQIEKLKTKKDITDSQLNASVAENKAIKKQLSDAEESIAELKFSIEDKESHIGHMKTLIQTLSEEKKEYEMKNTHQV